MLPSTILTNSRVFYNFAEPTLEQINLEDIAHGLSNICRFNGQCKEFYSVAQHSVIVSHLVPKEYAMEALLHDATEAYLGDITTPLKNLLPEYRRLEALHDSCIRQKFKLPNTMSEAVREADYLALGAEKRKFFLDYTIADEDSVPNHFLQKIWPPGVAKLHFIHRYMELMPRVVETPSEESQPDK
jgi:uncharacterized protein